MAGNHLASNETAPPLAVDLDGTLIIGDVFRDSIILFLRANPVRIFTLFGWLMRGRAHAKARLAEKQPTDPTTLTYCTELLDWIRTERSRGRRVVLATACDRRPATAISEHLNLFDDVFASDGRINLKSRRKAMLLRKAFPDGFVYAGNETADLAVWDNAVSAIVVNASSDLERRVRKRFRVEKSFRTSLAPR